MQLKNYQKRVLSDLDTFMRNLIELKNIPGAYTQTWLENGVGVGVDGGIQKYQDTIKHVPHICFKVPTGGGKTLLACAALKHIYSSLEKFTFASVTNKIVVWLVPSSAILEQTLKALRNPNHEYRRQINTDFNGKVEVYDGTQVQNAQNFSPSTVRENLSIIVMTFDALRITRKEGRKVYQENGSLEPFVSFYEHPETLIPDVEINALMQVLNQLSPVIIIDESHNAESDLSVEMLRNLNPSFVLDLTATPKKNSNIISIVGAYELKQENMVKLPVIVYNRQSPQDVLFMAINLRRRLEERASDLEAKGGKYIRPIALIQAQPKTNADAATFEKIKTELILSGIPADHIAIKTSEINEIKNIDLLSPACPIRYIITVNALKEGWDCPFAYVLATLANRSSRVDVEQIVGRVLRLPYTTPSADTMLNSAYVLSSSIDFNNTVSSVIRGLNNAGFTDKDCRALDTSPDVPSSKTPPPDKPPQQQSFDDDLEIDPDEIARRLRQQDEEKEKQPDDPDPLTELERAAREAAAAFADRQRQAEQSGQQPKGGDEMRKRFQMRAEFEADASSLVLPQFVYSIGPSLFSDATTTLVTKESLTKGFVLADKDIQINFSMPVQDMTQVDVDIESRPTIIPLGEREMQRIKEAIRTAAPKEKKGMLIQNAYNQLNRMDYIGATDLRAYITRIVNNLDDDHIEQMENDLGFYISQIKKKIDYLVEEYREKQFYQMLDIGDIFLEQHYRFPAQIVPVPTMPPLVKSLYTDEANVNKVEFRLIQAVASLDNVVWWHRVISQNGFYLNAYLNHYPDFIIRTRKGNIIVLESKGDDRDNTDTRNKIRLGRKWADLAGKGYRYFMVFDEHETGIDDALVMSEFISRLREL